MRKSIRDKLSKCAAQSHYVVHLAPRIELLPLPVQRFDDPFLPFGRSIIEATQDIVCGYILDFPAYMALAAAGARALERTIALIEREKLRILHGPFLGEGYSAMADHTAFGVDALTVSNAQDRQFYMNNPPYGAIVTGSVLADEVCCYFSGNIKHDVKVIGAHTVYRFRDEDFTSQLKQYLIEIYQHDKESADK